uniref:uncharacterized protein LOC120328492 isoform X1 n=1 Tax=Styela clava TaxID=7725 RepID=UPI001939DA8F|nr:uncharacterized protein LOC120328492 isoform X1 [Styela clava]
MKLYSTFACLQWIVLILLPGKSICQIINSGYSFDCKPKVGCHISQCDPVPHGLAGIDINDYMNRNEYPLECQQKSGVSTKNLMKIVARLDQDLKKTKQDMNQQYNRILTSREARIERSEKNVKYGRMQDIKAEINKNNLYMEEKNHALERKLERQLSSEIESQIRIMNKTQEKLIKQLEQSQEKTTTTAINSLRTELTDAMNKMETRLLRFIEKTINNSPSTKPTRRPQPTIRRKPGPTKKPWNRRSRPLPKKTTKVAPTRTTKIPTKPKKPIKPQKTTKPSKPKKPTVITVTQSGGAERQTTKSSFERIFSRLFAMGMTDPQIPRAPPPTRSIHVQTTETPKKLINTPPWTWTGGINLPSSDKHCKVKHGTKCYWVEIFSWKNIDFDEASRTCEGDGGTVADINDSDLFDDITNLVRSQIISVDEHIVVWLGMKVDPKTGKLFLKNGQPASFSAWFPGYPDTGNSFSQAKNLYLYVQRNINSRYQGMVNVEVTGQYPGVVCER